MGTHPANLILRFLLEWYGLIGMGYWGYRLDTASIRFFFMAGIPVVASIVWWAFFVPGDPFRAGEGPVRIRGGVRLLLELSLFFFAVFCCYQAIGAVAGFLLLGLVILHYALSYERIWWLIRK